MKKIILVLISFLFMFSSIFSQNKITPENLKQHLVKGIVPLDKTYDFCTNYYFVNFEPSTYMWSKQLNKICNETDKAERFYEAYANSIDNGDNAWLTKLNRFTYEENKNLYSKIRNLNHLIVTIPIRVSDLDYNFDTKQFEVNFNGVFPIEVEYSFHPSIFLIHRGSLNIKMPMGKAKAFSKNYKSAVVVLLKLNEWVISGKKDQNIFVIDVDILNSIPIDGETGIPY